MIKNLARKKSNTPIIAYECDICHEYLAATNIEHTPNNFTEDFFKKHEQCLAEKETK